MIHVKPNGSDSNDGLSWSRAKRTIQAALEAARPGDQVWVAAGLYNEQIKLKANVELYGGFKGTETSLSQRPSFPRPSSDPYASVLDGRGNGPVVAAVNLGSGSQRIDGFVIQNGYSPLLGGGIYFDNSDLIISNNTITGNSASGGGINCGISSSAVIYNNTIIGNSGGVGGGGINCGISSSAVIYNNTIIGNSGGLGGGGIACGDDSYSIISNNTITGNSASGGGGIDCGIGSSVVIYNNTIIGNSTELSGGGISCASDSYSVIYNNTIIGNSTDSIGGGICSSSSSTAVYNNIITGNSAGYGGGIYCYDSSPTIYNNTIADNTATITGGGIYCSNASPAVCNNIVAFNSSGINCDLYSFPTLRSNCVYNYGYNYYGISRGVGDINVDPLFVNRSASDYHIRQGSPCIDRGYSGVVGSEWVDMDGQPRICGLNVDIGADEWYPPPSPYSLSPNTKKLCPRTKYTFTTTWRSDAGYSEIAYCYLVFNSTTSPSGKQACYVAYDRSENKLYLRDDASTTWLGGYAPGSPNTIENGYSKIYCAESSVSGSGMLLTLKLSIEFKQPLADKTTPGTTLKAWMLVTDSKGSASAWIQKGEYTWLAPVSISPSTGKLSAGTGYTFTTTWRDDDGYADIKYCYLIFNSTTSPSGKQACYVKYDRAQNKIYLMDDAGTTWLGGYAPGSSSTIENGYSKLYCSASSVSGSGKLLTLKLSIEFKQPLADKTTPGTTLKAWMLVTDSKGSASAWIQKGEYTWLAPVSISPSTGKLSAGTGYTFTTTWRDDDGYADIKYCYLIFNSTTSPSGKQACYVKYDRAQNKLYLIDDAGTTWLGGYAPGSSSTIENGYSKLYCSASSVSGSGKLLTLKLRIEFKQALPNKIPAGGTLNAWMLIADAKGSASGWILKGGYQP